MGKHGSMLRSACDLPKLLAARQHYVTTLNLLKRLPLVRIQVYSEESMALKVGDDAPDFSVTGVLGVEKIKFTLGEHRGKKNVVIAFYPLDWTPV